MKRQPSDLLYFWCSDVRVVLLDLYLSHLYEVTLTLVVFGQPVTVAVRTITVLAANAQQSNTLIALEATRRICLLAGRSLGDFGDLEAASLLGDLFGLAVLPELHPGYLKHTEHIILFWGFP